MHRNLKAVLPLFLLLLLPHTAAAQTGQTDVQATLDALDAWLSQSDNGPGWKAFLKTDELQQELAKKGAPDREVLQQQLEVYSSSTPGLSKSNFRDVRSALESWLAELELPAQDELGNTAEEAVTELAPVDEEKLSLAKEDLTKAAMRFESYISRGGESKAEGWKAFLNWEEFVDELEQESPNLDILNRTWAQLCSNTPGLSYREFVEVREALGSYLELAEFFESEDNALANLPEQLKAFQDDAGEQAAADLGLTLGWLQRTNQAESTVQAIHRHYRKPNLFVETSEALTVYGFAEHVDQTDPISNYSDGNSTSGTGHTVADVMAELEPNGARGQVVVNMEGTINSQTRTYNNQGVSFQTRGVTTVDAEKNVYFGSRGMVDDPANARAVTDNTTYNIQANSAQVRNIAQQRIAQRERSSELQAARRAEQKVESDLNRRIREQIKDANDRMQRDFFGPLAKRGVELPYNRSHSTHDWLYQRMILAGPNQLAAPNDPPEMKAQGDVIARAHTSWINNLADITLRGSLLTDVSLAEAMEEWRGEVPEELQVTDESEPWDITYASQRPLWLQCSKDQLHITLRGQRFTARDRVMNEPMHISATYKVNRGGGKISLVREGDVVVEFPEQGDRLSPRMIATRNFWRTKFSALFTEEFKELDLNLRGAWESAGPLKLSALGVHPDGWVGIAWRMPEESEKAEPAADTAEGEPAE